MGLWIAWGCLLVGSMALGAMFGMGAAGMLRQRIYGPHLRVLSACWRTCPFCGGQPFMRQEREDELGTRVYLFTCRRCEAHGPWQRSEDQALQGWNRRVR